MEELKKQALLKQWIGECYVGSAMADPVTALEREKKKKKKKKQVGMNLSVKTLAYHNEIITCTQHKNLNRTFWR